MNSETDKQRRKLLVGGMAAINTGWLSYAWGKGEADKNEQSKVAVEKDEKVPDYRISLASYGGEPGETASVLITAFERAFADLKKKGGGMLLVPAGLYDFGRHANSTLIVKVEDLSNIVIRAHGATFRATTTAKAMPFLFYFTNPNNVTIDGARFTDPGFDPELNWKGMYCAGIQADRPSRGFRMRDCYARNVVGLFSSNNNEKTRHFLADIDIGGEVRDSYYGVGASYIRERVRVNLTCHNVRRAFIAYSLKDADISITASSTEEWPGSNGFVSLVSSGASMGNVEDVRVTVNASGAGIYGSYVHFYHQGPEIEGVMRNIDATVNVTNVRSKSHLFVFDHEINSVKSKTARVWDQIYLRGSVNGDFGGRIISNPSVSTSANAIYVDRNLALLEKMSRLPAYFRVKANP